VRIAVNESCSSFVRTGLSFDLHPYDIICRVIVGLVLYQVTDKSILMRATRIAISGFSSGVGKTTLMCDLLSRFPGWEAIKISRGHYRSCGKNPEACCISPLLGEEPRVFSGRLSTFSPRKDTGRYWAAGAGNVHWVICTNDQVESGVKTALDQVKADGVFVEGTSFLKYFPVDYSLMVVSPSTSEIKSSAARVMERIDALYIAGSAPGRLTLLEIRSMLRKRGVDVGDIPVFCETDLADLSDHISKIHGSRTAASTPRLIEHTDSQ
jgi:hypothetical protein